MRIVFMGTPSFALPALRALADGADVVGVVTQPDRPAGRGRRPAPPPVKNEALARELPLLQPERPRDDVALVWLRERVPDAIVVVAYGRILPPAVLDLPRFGCVNLHASLLPRWRGAAPVQWALLAGDATTGVTIMRMNEGLDTGPILLAEELAIDDEDNAGTLESRLAVRGAGLLLRALDGIAAGTIAPTPQDDARATHAPKVRKEDARLDFARGATDVRARCRAMDPEPGPWTLRAGEPLRLFGARETPGAGPAGAVLAAGDRLVVACANGAVAFAEAQPAGGRRMPIAAYLRGRPIAAGTVLGA